METFELPVCVHVHNRLSLSCIDKANINRELRLDKNNDEKHISIKDEYTIIPQGLRCYVPYCLGPYLGAEEEDSGMGMSLSEPPFFDPPYPRFFPLL